MTRDVASHRRAAVWHAAVRDLIWRRRRYAISVVGTALVFAVSLLVTGISEEFGAELDRTFDTLAVEAFVVPEDLSGPFTGTRPFDPSQLPDGVSPMAYLVQTANPDDPQMVATLGLEPGAGEPAVVAGTQLAGPDDAIVASDSGFPLGSTLRLGSRTLTVVGETSSLSINAGMPIVIIPLETFQAELLGGLPLVSAGITGSAGVDAPPGFRIVDPADAKADALRVLGDAASTISLVRVLLWIVAALILGSVMYLSAVERTGDFAVFRAIGSGTAPMAGALALQAALLSLAAAALGELLALVLAPVFPMRVTLTMTALVGMPVVALVVGLVAGSFALRRAMRVDPALAFGGGS